MKIYLLLTLSIGALLFGSCKKSYTCTCSGGFGGTGTTFSIESASKKHASNKCASHNNSSDIADGYYNCGLNQ